jgi:hypothetical protein
MPSSLNIPLPLESNRRVARRLLHFLFGLTQAFSLTGLILFFILTPRPTHTIYPDSISLWFDNNAQALTFFEKNLGQLSILHTNLTLFEILQSTDGPYTLIWNNHGQLVSLEARPNTKHLGAYEAWQSTSQNISFVNSRILIGSPQTLTRRFWPKWPWQAGTLQINGLQTLSTSYTLNNDLNRLLVKDRLLERTTTDLNNPHVTMALAIDQDQADFWRNLEIPLSFPGLNVLVGKLTNTNSTLSLEESSVEQNFNLALQDPLSPLEAETLLQDLLLGTNNVSSDKSDLSHFTYLGKSNNKSARIIVTPQSTSINLNVSGNFSHTTSPFCVKNPLARLSLPSTFSLPLSLETPPEFRLVIESNQRSTGFCFVDN